MVFVVGVIGYDCTLACQLGRTDVVMVGGGGGDRSGFSHRRIRKKALEVIVSWQILAQSSCGGPQVKRIGQNPSCLCAVMLSDIIIDDETLLKILALPVLVVLDEAYVEFSGVESRMGWVKKYENLIVLRTFSKRAGTIPYYFKELI
ncbi:Aminotransferase class I and II domain-containing protein [Forsythia ovata]|uniref:histidinol-phosphate transaminase n=1 Tax=Forsythia ovata TaxID=205694 RepID=A0ABD1UX40_9LAMI